MTRSTLCTLAALLLIAAFGWILIGGATETASAPLAFGDVDLETLADREGGARVVERIGPEPERTTPAADDFGPLGRARRQPTRIRGRVLDPFDRPVADAAVQLEFRQRGRSRGGHRVRQPVTTGIDGRFEFRGVAYEQLSVTLRIRHARYAPKIHAAEFDAVDGRVDVGDIRLLSGGWLVGRIVDENGNGIADATVTPHAAGDHPSLPVLAPVATNGHGFYRSGRLSKGSYRVTARAPRMQRGRLREPLDVIDDKETVAPVIRLGSGFALTGKVFAPDGAPFAGADVRVFAVDGDRPEGGFRTRSLTTGGFEVDHLPAATLRVEVRASDHVTWTRDSVDARLGRPLLVQLVEGLAIHGTVTDSQTGVPIEQFAAKVRRVGSRANTGDSPAPIRIPTDLGAVAHRPDGRFGYTGLDEGSWVVDVQSPEHQLARSETVVLSSASGPVEIAIRVERGLTVAGTIVARGTPLAGARVELRRLRNSTRQSPSTPWSKDGDTPEGDTVSVTRSNADTGRFAFSNVPAGAYVVAARHDRYAATQSDVLDLHADRSDVRLALPEPAVIHGHIAGAPFDEQVRVFAFGGFGRIRIASADPDGSYRIERLQPGEYLVRAFVGETGLYVSHQMRSLFGGSVSDEPTVDVAVAAGEVRELPLVIDVLPLGSVRGRVTRNGGPVAGMRVSLGPAPVADRPARPGFRFGDDSGFAGKTDAAGAFAIADVPAGAYVLSVHVDGQDVVTEPVAVVARRPTVIPIDLSR